MEIYVGLDAEEEVYGRHQLVILSHGLWMRRFAGDSSIVGRTIVLDGAAHQVIGVGLGDYL